MIYDFRKGSHSERIHQLAISVQIGNFFEATEAVENHGYFVINVPIHSSVDEKLVSLLMTVLLVLTSFSLN